MCPCSLGGRGGGHSQLLCDFCLGNAMEERDADGSIFCLKGVRGVAAACAHPVAQCLFREGDTRFPVQQLMWLVLNQCQPHSPLSSSVCQPELSRPGLLPCPRTRPVSLIISAQVRSRQARTSELGLGLALSLFSCL